MTLHKIMGAGCLLALLVVLLVGIGATQQTEIKHVPIQRTARTSGREMYQTYCAVCHGIDGKGHGPAVEALKVPPPDLTTLARLNGGRHPSDHVRSAIEGDLRLSAHGTKEMPVWGYLFWRMSQGQGSEVQLRVVNLNSYVASLQEK